MHVTQLSRHAQFQVHVHVHQVSEVVSDQQVSAGIRVYMVTSDAAKVRLRSTMTAGSLHSSPSFTDSATERR